MACTSLHLIYIYRRLAALIPLLLLPLALSAQEPVERIVTGFPHPALSADGRESFAYISLMPLGGYVNTDGTREEFLGDIASPCNLSAVEHRPGYVGAYLSRWNIRAEVASADSLAVYRFTFVKGNRYANILIDLDGGVGPDAMETRVVANDFFNIAGYRTPRGMAADTLFFAIAFDRPAEDFMQDSIGARYFQPTFEVDPGTTIQAFVSVSTASIADAYADIRDALQYWALKQGDTSGAASGQH